MDIVTVGVASVISLQGGDRVCRDVRIALGAVAPTPIRAYTAEGLLRGQRVTPELIEAVSQEAQDLATPIDDIRGSAAYRKAMVAVLTQRTLARAVEMALGNPVPFELQRNLAVQRVF